MDAREFEGDDRSLMNLHNNKAGRKVSKFDSALFTTTIHQFDV